MAWLGFIGAVISVALGVFLPGWPWLFFGPTLLLSSWLYGHLTGIALGANVFVAAILAGFAMGLDMGVMATEGWLALQKALVVFFMAQIGSTFGWMHMADILAKSDGPPNEPPASSN